jgi:head-tail adaptor
MGAGDLREVLRFEKRAETPDDGTGVTDGDWETIGTFYARVQPKKLGLADQERILSARLTGTALVTITVRYSTTAKLIGADCRAVDTRDTTRIYNVRSSLNLDEHRKHFVMDAEMGVAT